MRSKALVTIKEQAEPLAPLINFEETPNETSFKYDERPCTASRSRVVFKFESKHRPMSATVKKNPLYHPRDIHTLRIASNCVRLQFTLPKAIRKHLTIKDLYL